LAECRAGLRRWAGTDYGDRYGRLLSHVGDPSHADPSVGERSLGDYLDPSRPGGATALVNAASRECGTDAAAWRWARLVTFVASLERERREQSQQLPDA
jgi:hypothetical protein